MSAAAQRFELSPSASLAWILVGLHAVAGACVLAVLPAPWGAALAAGLLALGLATAWTRALLRSARSVRALELKGTAATLELAGGQRIPCEIAERRYVSRLLVSVLLRRPNRSLLITGDMLPADAFRRLRLWALWGGRTFTPQGRTYSG